MRIAPALIVIVCLVLACGPGWDGYEKDYTVPGPVPATPWEGDQSVFVVLGGNTVEVALAGMKTYDYHGSAAVSLSELVIKSGLTGTPASYVYDFTATDGYDLLRKRYDDPALLPGWTEMQHGVLYLDSRYDDLTSGWTQYPWGSALSAYLVKWMNGGTITLLTE